MRLTIAKSFVESALKDLDARMKHDGYNEQDIKMGKVYLHLYQARQIIEDVEKTQKYSERKTDNIKLKSVDSLKSKIRKCYMAILEPNGK